MSESDTMFNKRDQRCTAVQLMLSTGPFASTFKMQIWIATNNRDMPRVMKTKFPAKVMVFGVVSSEGHIMPPHIFEISLKVNTKVYLDVLKSVVIPWCNQVAGSKPWVCQPTSPKKPRLGFRRSTTTLYPSPHCPPPSPTWTRWTTSFGHTSRTSPMPAWLPPSAKYLLSSHWCLWKRHASQFRIRIEAVIEAEGSYIE